MRSLDYRYSKQPLDALSPLFSWIASLGSSAVLVLETLNPVAVLGIHHVVKS